MTAITLARRTPGTMLGLAARDYWRAKKRQPCSPSRARAKTYAKYALTLIALMIGLSGFSMSSASAWSPWGSMKDNITATIVNVCGPNDVPTPVTYTGIDTMAGLNRSKPAAGYRSTIKPDFSKDNGGAGAKDDNGMARLQRVYGQYGNTIARPTYQRYGFSPLQWHQYGYSCFSPTLMMGPLANLALIVMVQIPMMISMAVLNLAMDNALYTAFAQMIQPFIGAMYHIFNPWIFFIVPIGVGITWLGSKASLQATLKAAGWGVMILSIFLLMGSSTSKIVTWATNIVTEVSGTAACKMDAASHGKTSDTVSPNPRTPTPGDPGGGGGSSCDASDPVQAVQQALWYGIPYQTWELGQVGEHQSKVDEKALKNGKVGWGPAILNSQYVGVTKGGNVDPDGRAVLRDTASWNAGVYSPDDGKVKLWGKSNQWDKVPYLANVKILCNDHDSLTDDPGTDGSDKTRWFYKGYSGSDQCDPSSAGTSSMIPYIKGDAYNQQLLVAMSGMVGAGAVGITVVVAAMYLGFQKMMFFFLLFLAPIVLLVSAIGDRKRRPFAIRYAEIIGANLLKQIAAVCIVLFVSYSMGSLFGSSTFSAVPWIMKPMVAFLFFLALVFLAFPLKNMIKGAIKGDTSVLDKRATAPQRAVKTVGKTAAVAGAVAATGGVAAATGAGGAGGALAGAGGKAEALGKAGSMLGQAGRVMGIGSKTGRAMRASGQLMRAGQQVMEAQDIKQGQRQGIAAAAAGLLRDPKTGAKYRDQDGNLRPDAQKMAMKDAQRLAEKGERTDRAAQAQDARMKSFFTGYRAEHGEFHKGDPTSPENQRLERLRREQERRQTKRDADAADALDQPQPRPGPPPRPEPGPDPAPNPGPGPKPGPQPGPGAQQEPGARFFSGPYGTTDSQAPINYEQYVEQARENLSGPAFSREMEYNVNTVRSGEDVLTNAGLSKSDVIKNPTVLLSGDAYNGGSTVAMDPFHPATGALNELRFAASSGNEDAIQSAVARAVDAIDAHGVPNQIDGVHSIGDRAASFEPIQVLGAMPQLSENSTWQERADAAHTMMAAQVAMPEDFAARQSVQDYTAALANPGVDVSSLAAIKESTMTDIANAMQSQMGEVGASTMATAFATEMAAGHDSGQSYTPQAPAQPQEPAQAQPSTPAPQASTEQPMTREDMRDAVADGLREARLERDAADTSNGWPAGMASTPPPPSNHTGSESAPASVASVPSVSHSTGAGHTRRPAQEYVADDLADVADAAEGLVYRPKRKKRKRTDHDDEED